MKKLVLSLLLVATFSNCRLPDFQAKPVTIDGLGSLSLLQNKQLTEGEFNKLLKEISKLKRVNEQDAQAMSEIFKFSAPHFSNASQNTEADENIVGSRDVEYYLKLIINYEQLRKPIEETMWREAERMLMQKIGFLNPEGNTGSFVGQFISVYARAFTQSLETNKSKEKILEEKEGETNFYVNLLALKVFEEKALEVINQNQASKEEKEKAKQFLENIKTYNEAMPVDKKVLGADGRLVDPNASSTNDGQQINMNRLAQGGINYDNKPQAEEASRRIGNLVRPTATEIRNEIKGAYKP